MALLCPWIAFAQNPPTSCTTTSQNLWVRDQLNTYYYWYQFLPPGVNPASFTSPEAYLEAVRYRPIDNTFSFITSAASNDAFYSDSQFIGYGFGNQTTTTEIRVLQVYDDSPASEAGLSRGDRIVTVNGQSVSSMVADGTIGGAFGAAEIGVASRRSSGKRRPASAASARMVKRLVTIPTVSLTSVVEVDGRKVGYLFFRNFVQPSIAALDRCVRRAEDGRRHRAGARSALQRRRPGRRGGSSRQPDRRHAHQRPGDAELRPQRQDRADPQQDDALRESRAGAQPAAAGGDHDARLGVGERARDQFAARRTFR